MHGGGAVDRQKGASWPVEKQATAPKGGVAGAGSKLEELPAMIPASGQGQIPGSSSGG